MGFGAFLSTSVKKNRHKKCPREHPKNRHRRSGQCRQIPGPFEPITCDPFSLNDTMQTLEPLSINGSMDPSWGPIHLNLLDGIQTGTIYQKLFGPFGHLTVCTKRCVLADFLNGFRAAMAKGARAFAPNGLRSCSWLDDTSSQQAVR